MRTAWLVVPLLCIPFTLEAAVTFSEIAWMGSAESANHEWIELYNDGPATNVSGWTITDGNNLSIELVGTIPANDYAVLERTSEASALGSAFLIYTGSLVNGGATLRLTNSSGGLVDQVSGGEEWENIGGDNTTKETAQYTTAGWITAPRTPGAPNATEASSQSSEDTEEDEQESSTHSSSSNTPVRSNSSSNFNLELPGVTLQLAIQAPTQVYVNQPIDFRVEPSGVGSTIEHSLTYEWNFGDGEVADTKTPSHTYRYPGTYVVAVYASYKRQEQIGRHEITVLPVNLTLGKNRDGDVMISNDAPYELDLSNYRLQGTHDFTLPPRTFLLPNQTITIDYSKVSDNPDTVIAMYDNTGTAVDMWLPEALRTDQSDSHRYVIDQSPTPIISATAVSAPPATPLEHSDQQFTFATARSPEAASAPATTTIQSMSTTATPVALGTEAPPQQANRWPYLALIGLIIIAFIGALYKDNE
jgi:hypothetical protein